MSNARIHRSAGPVWCAALSLVVAGGAVFGLTELLAPGTRDPLTLWNGLAPDRRPLVAAVVLAPVLVGLLAILLAPKRVADGADAVAAADPAAGVSPAESATPDGAAFALRFLATLQEEARLLDFIREDVDGYSDAQVGAAARGIHAALRKAIDDRMQLEPVLAGDEGDPVQVPAGFDPAAIRLTGSPAGNPPFRGTLVHPGWRAQRVQLPRPTAEGDSSVLAPAEVEVS